MTNPDRTLMLQRIDRVREQFSGRLGVAATNLATGEEVFVEETHPFPTASTVKVPVLYELFRLAESGVLSLSDRIEVKDSDIVRGSGVLRDLQTGLNPTIHDLAMLMIIVSDNTATNMCIELAGGPAAITESMHAIGLDSIVVHRKITFDSVSGDRKWLAEAAPIDLMRLSGLIGKEEAVSPEASRGMLAIMRRQHSLIQFPRFLGYNPYAAESGEEQPYWIANKTGSVTGVRADTGLVGLPGDQLISFCVMTEGSTQTGFTTENEGEIVNGKLGRILLEYWWPEGFAEGKIGIDSPFMEGV